MSPTIPSPETDLRDRLGGALPDSYPALDLDAVLASGRRTVLRRRIGALVAGAATALVVAVGATQLAGGPPVTAPQPAQPSSGATYGTAHVTIAPNRGAEQHWTVTMGAAGADGQRIVTWRQDGGDGSVGSGISDSDRRASWGFGEGSQLVLGELPDEKAGQNLIPDDGGVFGGSTFTVVSIPGTGWSAFALAYEKPLTGNEPIRSLLWFDHLGRPVDQDGDVGSVTDLDGGKVWLTRDGSVLGRSENQGTGSTPQSGAMRAVLGDYPRVTLGTMPGNEWRTTIRLRPEATTATLVFSDGTRVPVTPVRLGQWSVAITPAAYSAKPPQLARVEWTSVGGVQHDDAVPPITAG